MTRRLIETVHPRYPRGLWQVRDNFRTLEEARGYVTFLSLQHPQTPYRIHRTTGYGDGSVWWVVSFIPGYLMQEWVSA